MTQTENLSPSHGSGRRLLLAILLVSLNLRGAITCVGPLLDQIQAAFNLSATAAGLLASLPLFAFAGISPYAAPLARRIGMERAIFLSLLLLLFGLGLRYVPGTFCLYLGTAFIGIGIAISNVLLPGLLRRDFPAHLAKVTALFTMVLVIAGGLGSGIAIPLANWAGWQISLLAWVFPVLLALVVWMPRLKRKTDPKPVQNVSRPKKMWHSGLAWQVSLFMAGQATAFYVMIAWLPLMLSDLEGISAASTGWILFVFQIFVLVAVMLVPVLIHRLDDQRWIGAGCSSLILVAYAGLLLATEHAMAWMILMGLGGGGSLVLAMTLFSLRVNTTAQTVALSGMAQAVGYTMAALAPILVGYLYDLTQLWTLPLLLMIGLGVLQVVVGYLAGRPLTIEEKPVAVLNR